MSEPARDDPAPAEGAEAIAEGVWRVPVRSATLPPFVHTNTYLIARSGVAVVVDPGGADEAAAAAVRGLARRAGVRPKGAVLTHTHPDHVAGVERLLETWPDLTVWVHPAELGRVDEGWRPVGLADGRRLTIGDEVLRAVHTPGHSPGHIALWYQRDRMLVAGDLVAGAGSVWIGLPDGDVRAYLDSLARAAALQPEVVAPGHGPVRRDGPTVFAEARAHRLQREAQVLSALRPGPRDLGALRQVVYGPLEAPVADLADRSLLAHLSELMRQGRAMHVGSGPEGPYLAAPGA